ncbi:MFS transporter [Leptolyngbya sp. 'hensonii']|uniref:HEAT repeat domain-containing protein n=1 Tax=Leptolyngbya sp. 'hensonii' TaxID=1922337 RepID=UPI00094F4BFB|nr:HEAT repeat domain-containing protein [Leptolyngbya sp. 'hensonii']OLP16449.1 MFS transporter [Leptolyngbya sp. 'hensonii']
MRDESQRFAVENLSLRLLRWLNLRLEEGERTVLMFVFNTVTAIGLSWFEASVADLFLDQSGFGASGLPWIYIASAPINSGLGILYSWLPKVLPLRQVIILIPALLASPLVLFYLGLSLPNEAIFGKVTLLGLTIVLMRLWLEVINVLNDLNASITANQLFNIREIKRTAPIVSSGVLIADIIGGFSLPVLNSLFGLPTVILLSCLFMITGASILFYLSQTHRQFFPDARRRLTEEDQLDATARRVQGPIRRYVVLLMVFFSLAQVLYLLLDFQFLSQLELWNQDKGKLAAQIGIAGFIGLFNGVLGVFEITMQWFLSSRIIERLGVFSAVMLLPAMVIPLGFVSLVGLLPFFVSIVVLKFWDELLRFTLFTSSGPILFQPLPDNVRARIQSGSRSLAEAIATGVTGCAMLALLAIYQGAGMGPQIRGTIVVCLIVIIAGIWVANIWLLRSRYVGLLVLGAERGQLSLSDVDLRQLKRAVIEALNRRGTEADKRSCIELLSHIDPQNVGEVLAPLLPNLPPSLQRQSLEEMMGYPNPAYLGQVKNLITRPLQPEVLAVALRYIWLTEPDPDIRQLRPYLSPEVDPVVRGTAASLVLRRGTSSQKAEATNTLRKMLTHKRERERVMGCRALGEADYMQALRLYIPDLLQDESLRVRCALLEAIAATHLEEYYPSLLKGLHYKSTREAAMRALIRLENEAIPMLVSLAEDIHKPDLVRMHAWNAIGQIGTLEAQNLLVGHLMTSWGKTRHHILEVLLSREIMTNEMGINAVMDRIGRSGVETLIDQELLFMGQIYAALADLTPERIDGSEAELLRRALRDVITDTVTRLFLLMKLLYPLTAIQAAAFNLQSNSLTDIARGLEILDNTLDIPSKRILLSVLDRRADLEKLQSLSELIVNQPLSSSDRLRYLLELRYFLSDWSLACCFHLARQARWSLTPEQTLSCLRHPTGFVREAVLSYLRIGSPRALRELLPMLKNDPDVLVAAQVNQMIEELEASSAQ